jgi:hypothetical protein
MRASCPVCWVKVGHTTTIGMWTTAVSAGELYVYLSDGGRAHFTQDSVDNTLYNAKAGATSASVGR